MSFKKSTLQTWFLIIGILLLWGMTQIQFDPTSLIRTLSLALIIFPLTLLVIFAHPKTRNSIKKHYWIERECTLAEIKNLRRKQEEIENLEEQITIDGEILDLRKAMRSIKDNRFENCMRFSLLLFIISITFTFFDLGNLVHISNAIFQIIFFIWGFYYVFYMIESLFFSFNLD